jgi:hypothetical protein
MLENEDYLENLRELNYYESRINQLNTDRKKYMDNVIQANISYEIKFCQHEINRVKKEINRFKRIKK